MAVSTLSSGPRLLARNKWLFAVLALMVFNLILYFVVKGRVRPIANGIAHGHPSQIVNSATSTRKESLYPGQKIGRGKRLQAEAENEHPQRNPETNPVATNVELAVLQDMEKCSRAMNISEENMKHATSDLEAIAKNASAFLNAIWSIVPRNFPSKYKNPCWHSDLVVSRDNRLTLLPKLNPKKRNYLTEELVSSLTDSIFHQKHYQNATHKGTIFCLPYFFIAGFPKSASTSLDVALRKHSQIEGPSRKEPQWWTRTPLQFSNFNYLKLSILKYLLYFLSKMITGKVDMITYDGSQTTLWDSNFFMHHQDYCAMPVVLSRVLPNARFIILMRNPVTRLYSHYLHTCADKHSKVLFKLPKRLQQYAPDFHREVVADVEHFKGCLENRSLYECVNDNRFRSIPCGGVGFRITVGLYYVHLSKWLQFYPKEHFLFLRTEDISADPHSLMTKITEFLGVTPVPPSQAEQWLSKRFHVQSPGEYTNMREETRELLEQFYSPYNAMLAELTGDSRFKWEDNFKHSLN